MDYSDYIYETIAPHILTEITGGAISWLVTGSDSSEQGRADLYKLFEPPFDKYTLDGTLQPYYLNQLNLRDRQ